MVSCIILTSYLPFGPMYICMFLSLLHNWYLAPSFLGDIKSPLMCVHLWLTGPFLLSITFFLALEEEKKLAYFLFLPHSISEQIDTWRSGVIDKWRWSRCYLWIDQINADRETQVGSRGEYKCHICISGLCSFISYLFSLSVSYGCV